MFNIFKLAALSSIKRTASGSKTSVDTTDSETVFLSHYAKNPLALARVYRHTTFSLNGTIIGQTESDALGRVCVIEKAKKLLGFHPSFNFMECLRRNMSSLCH